MTLTRVTISGADDGVAIGDLLQLSAEFPFVEWGMLLSLKKQGSPRYPSAEIFDDLQDLAEAAGGRWPFAVHLCGEVARDALAGDYLNVEPYIEGFPRVQVNGFNQNPAFERGFAALLALYPDQQFIAQIRDEAGLCRARRIAVAHVAGNLVGLFDASGGRGVEQARWPDEPRDLLVGYAGGIGPDNVCSVLSSLAGRSQGYWIDMESGIRTDDRFDLAKVRRVLELAAPFVGGKESA